MRVAYLFESEHAREILETMIIPQLEEGRHGVEVAGMMFFFDNTYMLVEGSDIGARLQAISEKTGMLLMACDQLLRFGGNAQRQQRSQRETAPAPGAGGG